MKIKNELLISSEIFSCEILRAAVQAYNGLARIQVEQTAENWLLTFHECRYDVELTIHEFSNYLINLASVSL